MANKTNGRTLDVLTKLFTFGTITVLIGLIAIGFRNSTPQRQIDACTTNLKAIGRALHRYHDEHGTLPPAYVLGPDGKKWHSWRVLILPQLGERGTFDRYRMDEPWNGPNNKKLVERMPAIYGCPAVTNRSRGTTNYLAVVGTETAWPEHLGVSFEEITDGLAETVIVLETASSDIAWTEPRDISFQDAKTKFGNADDPDLPSSRHKKRICALTADGSVRRLFFGDEINRADQYYDQVRSLMTRSGGRPYGKLSPGKVNDRLSKIPAVSELTETTVTPYLAAEFPPGKNLIYCANFQIAWDELRTKVYTSPIQLHDQPEMVTKLNTESFDRANLSPDSYFVVVGMGKADYDAKVNTVMAEKFPDVTASLPTFKNPRGIGIYTRLQKNLPFVAPFSQLTWPLKFRGGEGKTAKLSAFGVDPQNSSIGEDPVRKQVMVLDYVSDDDFIIRLTTKSDDIILSKTSRNETLAATVARAIARRKDPVGSKFSPKLAIFDTLAVPLLLLEINYQFKPLLEQQILNPDHGERYIHEARQRIHFHLDEAGAVLESDVAITLTDDGAFDPNVKRRFVFDKPFLVMLQERNAERPYFAMWVENAELCVPFALEGNGQ